MFNKLVTKENLTEVYHHLGQLDWEKKYTIIIKLFRKNRSLHQNKLYWVWLNVLEEHSNTGYRKEWFHAYYKAKFLGVNQYNLFGDVVYEQVSTTKLNSEEFNVYLEKINQHALETCNCLLPWPESPGYDQMVSQYNERSHNV